MNQQEQTRTSIVAAVARLRAQLVSANAQTVGVNLSEQYLVVTLQGALCDAEKQYAQDRSAKNRLEELYTHLFDAAKYGLDDVIGDILGRRVQRSTISIDPMLGDATLVFVLGQGLPNTRAEPQEHQEGNEYVEHK
jgi:uncharacterized protein YbcI